MVLQAFVDDSRDGHNDDVMVLAAYIAPSEKWALFSAEWQELLDMPPPWPYFKMSEVAHSGGDRSRERTEWLYRVLERHVSAGVIVAINKPLLSKVVESYGLPDTLKNPYHMASKAVINLAAQEHEGLGFHRDDSVDFIFDRQSESDQLLEAWRGGQGYRNSVPTDVREVTGNDPIFRDSKIFLPLQAADLCAWWYRKRWENYGTILMDGLPFPWEIKRDYRRLLIEPSEEDMHEAMRRVRRELDAFVFAHARVTVTAGYGDDAAGQG